MIYFVKINELFKILKYVFEFIHDILNRDIEARDKDEALKFFQALRQQFRGWNSAAWGSSEFERIEKDLSSALKEKTKNKVEEPSA